jgi:hypothetical protein
LLDSLAKAKDRAFGTNRLKLMDEEIKATKQMLANQEKLRDA